jgi:hypothetical protein
MPRFTKKGDASAVPAAGQHSCATSSSDDGGLCISIFASLLPLSSCRDYGCNIVNIDVLQFE